MYIGYRYLDMDIYGVYGNLSMYASSPPPPPAPATPPPEPPPPPLPGQQRKREQLPMTGCLAWSLAEVAGRTGRIRFGGRETRDGGGGRRCMGRSNPVQHGQAQVVQHGSLPFTHCPELTERPGTLTGDIDNMFITNRNPWCGLHHVCIPPRLKPSPAKPPPPPRARRAPEDRG